MGGFLHGRIIDHWRCRRLVWLSQKVKNLKAPTLKKKFEKRLYDSEPITPIHNPPKKPGGYGRVSEAEQRFFTDFNEFADVVNWWLADEFNKSRWRLQELPDADRSLNVNFDAGPMPGRCYALFFNQVKSGRLEIADAYGYSAENPKIHTNIEIDNPRLLGIDDIMSVVGAVELHVTDSQTERIQADQSVHFALTKTLWDNYRISQFSKLDLGQDWGELLVNFEGTASFYIGRRQAWLQERAQKATATRPIDTWRPERTGSPPPAKAAKAAARNFEGGGQSVLMPHAKHQSSSGVRLSMAHCS